VTDGALGRHRQASALVDVGADGRPVRLEYQWLDAPRADAPLVVYLHEGLGSVAMWKDLPRTLCAATGTRGLVYSREGYGRSTPRARGERWPVDFMHRQAGAVLPALLDALGVDAPVWLLGHSDGASIALLFAAAFPARVRGVIAVAPHIMVEPVSIASIAAACDAYASGDLRSRLARHHDDPDSAFFGWSDAWLAPAFRGWTIEAELAAIACPVLAIQGVDDIYGTMAQIDGIAQRAPDVQRVKLAAAGHAPFRDQPLAFNAAVVAFLRAHGVHAGDGC
jgi:pimeloyl-ACP methyl ester carboxylesterase